MSAEMPESPEERIDSALNLLAKVLTQTGGSFDANGVLMLAQLQVSLAIAERLKGVELHVIREEP